MSLRAQGHFRRLPGPDRLRPARFRRRIQRAPRRARSKSIIHSYLVEHPEMLRDIRRTGKEAAAGGKRPAPHGHRAEQGSLFKSAFQGVIGNPKGKITLVELFDYNCGYCKRALGDLVDLMKAEPELRVVLKDFPVLGPDSVEAAQIASAARKQISGDKFWEFHQKLLLTNGHVGTRAGARGRQGHGARHGQAAEGQRRIPRSGAASAD